VSETTYPACRVCGDTKIIWSPTLDGESMNRSACPAPIHDDVMERAEMAALLAGSGEAA
jgi:hypothetical protein